MRDFSFSLDSEVGRYEATGRVEGDTVLHVDLVTGGNSQSMTHRLSQPPIFAAVLGVFLLRERVHLRRWSAIGVGFAGTLVVLRPGFQAVDLGSSLVLVSALLWAATMIVIKVLGRTESSMTITCYMNLLLTGLSLLPALFVWQAPSPAAWFWLLLIGLLGTAAQIALAQSLKEAETSVVMPFDFLKLIWTAALGYWLFSEAPDIFVWIGGAIIFVSSVYIAYRESRVSKASGVGGLDGPAR